MPAGRKWHEGLLPIMGAAGPRQHGREVILRLGARALQFPSRHLPQAAPKSIFERFDALNRDSERRNGDIFEIAAESPPVRNARTSLAKASALMRSGAMVAVYVLARLRPRTNDPHWRSGEISRRRKRLRRFCRWRTLRPPPIPAGLVIHGIDTAHPLSTVRAKSEGYVHRRISFI